MKFKSVMRWDAGERKLRLFRLIWNRSVPSDDYSLQFSVALMPRLFALIRAHNDMRLVIFGVSLHWKRSYGGLFV